MFQQLNRQNALKEYIREALENFQLSYLFNEDKFEERIEQEAKSNRNMYRAALDIADEILISHSKALHNATF